MNLKMLALGLAGAAVAANVIRRARQRDLQGSVVAITGGSRGLGLVLAEEFARHGCRLAICARDPQKLDAARERLAAQGAEVLAMPCDVRSRDEVERFIEATTERFGRIDTLVNNAGIMSMGPLDTLGIEAFEDAMATMFWGPLYATMAVAPQMRSRHEGTIVNISSIGGKLAAPHLLPYTAAKFATTGLSEGLHAELAPHGISVLTVAPGFMRTGSTYNATFAGKPRVEFAVFNILGNLPLTSIPARDAATQIVKAVRRRESELIISPQARAAAFIQGMFPGVTAHLLAAAARTLPNAPAGPREATGWDSRSRVSESFLTAAGRKAARELQQAG